MSKKPSKQEWKLGQRYEFTQKNLPDNWPDQYLAVEECQSGMLYILPLRGSAKLDVTLQVKRWIKEHFCGDMFLSGRLQRCDGEYYASLILDNRPWPSAVVWGSGGFYVTDDQYEHLRSKNET